MDKKDEIEDSTEFVNDIKLYYDKTSNTIKQNSHYDNASIDNTSAVNPSIDNISAINPSIDSISAVNAFIENTSTDNSNSECPYKNSERLFKNSEIFDYANRSNHMELHSLNNEIKSTASHKFYQLMKELMKLILCIVVALFIAECITNYIGQHTEVEGYSMENTLHDGDNLIIDKLSYRFKDPKRYDIIVFPYSEGVNYIKRIVGLPGETLQIINGKIYINGEILEENYGKETIRDPGEAGDPVVLGSDEYFVMGDNRNHSMDSRSTDVGTISRDKIVGKAWLKIWPLKDFGILNHK